MPKTPGEYLTEKYPDRFAGKDPARVDESIRRQLTDPVKRAETLQKLRRDIPKLAAVPDDAVLMDTFGRIDARYKPADVPPARIEPNAARAQQEGMRMAAGGRAFGTNQAALGKLDAETDAPDAIKEAASTVRRTNLTPQDAQSPRVQGRVGQNIPASFERMDEMQEAAQKNGLKIVQANGGGSTLSNFLTSRVPNIQLQDQQGNTVSQLTGAATFTPKHVEGMPATNLGEITGQGSTLQQAITETARDVWDPKTGTWFRGMKEARGTPDQLANPLARADSYGFREFGMDAAARQTDDGLSYKLANTVVAPLSAGMAAVDKAEEWAARGLGALSDAMPSANPWEGLKAQRAPSAWHGIADSNKEESEKYWAGTKQLMDNAWGTGLPDTPEARAEANKGLGATMGEALSMKLPTGGDKLVGALAPAAAAGVGTGARAVSRAVEKAAPDLHQGLVGLASTLPAATTMGREAADVMKGARAAGKNAGDVAEVQFNEQARRALGNVLPADKIDDAVREAQGAWHSVAARKALSPEGKAALEALQPMHEQAFRSMFGQKIPYNPLHVFRGQRANKAARVLESARTVDAAEDVALQAEEFSKDVGRKHMGPIQQGAVPGWNKIQGQAELREARSWADTRKMLEEQQAQFSRGSPGGWKPLKEGAARRDVEEMDKLDLVSGIAKTWRLGRESKGLRRQEAARVFFENIDALKKEAPKSYMPVDQRFGKSVDELFAQDLGRTPENMWARGPDGKRLVEVNAYRDAIQGGRNLLAPDVSRALAEADEVVVRGVVDRAGDVDQLIKVTDPKRQRVVFVPGLQPGMDGMVMPRAHALAMLQAGSNSAAERMAANVAATVDQVLGLTQLNYHITKGNPGFEARNRISEILRLAVDDKDHLSQGNRELVQRVLSAPVGGPTRDGQLHAELLRLGGLGKGIIEDVRGGKSAGMANPRPLWMSEKAGRVINAPANAADWAQDQLVNEPLRRGLFPGMPKTYSVEDGFRAAVMLSEMSKGSRATTAAAHMKRLLIDYGDYNALERAAKPVVPFIKYYTGAAEGAVALAMKNPRKFARVWDMARIMERWDTEFEGGGKPLNQKLKSTADILSGAAMVEEGGTISMLRPETTASELAGQIEMGEAGWAGLFPRKVKPGDEPERGLSSYLGPAVSNLTDTMGGLNLATGRSTVGLSALEQERAAAEGATTGPGQALWAYGARKKDKGVQRTGDDDLALGRDLLRYVPFAGRIGDAPWLRAVGGLNTRQTNPASRSDESMEAMLRRTTRGWTTGIRSSTVTPSQEFLKDQKKNKPPPSMVDIKRKNSQAGR